MAQRFVMAHTLYRSSYGFPVNNISRAKGHIQAKAFPDNPLQNLHLYCAHKLDMNLPKLPVPNNMKLWIFLL